MLKSWDRQPLILKSWDRQPLPCKQETFNPGVYAGFLEGVFH